MISTTRNRLAEIPSRIDRRRSGKLDRALIASAYLYLIVPICLFALGWLRLHYALIVVAALVLSLRLCMRGFGDFIAIRVSAGGVLTSFGVCALIFIWVAWSGIGGFAFQNDDHNVRNAVLHDLINYRWPVIYDFAGQHSTSSYSNRLVGNHGALVYYLAYWLPAASIGKAFGWKAANVALYAWSSIGVILTFYLFWRLIGKRSVLILLLFISWSGMDVLGYLCYSGHLPALGEHIEWWTMEVDPVSYPFQYSSNTTSLFWAFNQAIPAWVVMMLFLNETPPRNGIFTWVLAFLYAPFPFIGMTPFVMYSILSARDVRRSYLDHAIERIRSCLTVQNGLIAPVILLFAGLYYASNDVNLVQRGLTWNRAGEGVTLTKYLLFCLFEFGAFAFVIASDFKKNPWFVIAVVSLVIIPNYSVDIYNDFSMRVSTPALLVLMVLVAKTLVVRGSEASGGWMPGARRFALVALLLVGAVTPFNEMFRTVDKAIHYPNFKIADVWRTLSVLNRIEYIDVFVANKPEETFFFRYLARE